MENLKFEKGGIINPSQYNNKSDWISAYTALEFIVNKWINICLKSNHLDTHIIANIAIIRMSKN